MLSNVEFNALLERYDDDPGPCSKLLRMHSLADPATFLAYSQAAILERPVSRVLKFIAGLAIAAGIIQVLLEVFPRDRQGALSLAKKVIQCEPRFDLAMAEYLSRLTLGSLPDESAVHIIIDLLEVISEGDRLVPNILKLLKHPSPKVRSKAALFVGSRTQNVAWATSRMQESDGRVRANIVESLYGMNSDVVHQIFRNHVHDDDNRAAGNAVLGLYQLGDPAAIPLIYEMARHAQPKFRNTCAWVIARTIDPRFLPLLAELIQDPDEIVRSQGFKALAELKRAARASRSPLDVSIVRMQTNGGQRDLVATVHDDARQPVRRIPATAFIARAAGTNRIIRNFSVEEYDCRSSLSLAFVVCLPESGQDEIESECLDAIEACAALRRSKDRWAIAKISGRTGVRMTASEVDPSTRPKRGRVLNLEEDQVVAAPSLPLGPRIEYSVHASRLNAMLNDAPVRLDPNPDNAATKSVLETLFRSDATYTKSHIVFIGAGPQVELFRTFAQRAGDLSAVLHVLALSPSWASQEIQDLATSSGGSFQSVTQSKPLRRACETLYASFLHCYRFTWTDDLNPTDLEVWTVTGRGHAVYDCTPVADMEPMALACD